MVNLFLYSLIVLSSLNPSGSETRLNSEDMLDNYVENLYSTMDYGQSPKPEFDSFREGVSGFLVLKKEKKLGDNDILTLMDFSLSANKPRMWVFDLKSKKLLYHTLVAHGRNSGQEFATRFSNKPQSNQTSLGFYVTGNTYYGKHGLSLKLEGMDVGFNDNAEKRAIVIHGANYVSPSFIRQYGRLGRSLGCPALPEDKSAEIIENIAQGTCLFIYYPDPDYQIHSISNKVDSISTFLENEITDLYTDSPEGH